MADKPQTPRHSETLRSDDVHDSETRDSTLGGESGGDISSKWLASYTGPRPELTDEYNTKIRKRIDKWLLPVIFIIYFNQQQDKSSVAFAAVFGFRDDAGLDGSKYSWLTTIIYIAQLVFQPVSVYALVKFKVNHWIIFCFIGWSASCMILAAFTSFTGLLIFRFILGAFEASISPSMMIIVSGWWTRREQPLRNNAWYSANGIALIVGSAIAYGLGRLENPSLHIYQYIFLVNGAIGLICVIPCIFLLPSHITTARFFNDEQKYLALERIRLNNTGTQNTDFKWAQVRECFLDPKQWMFTTMGKPTTKKLIVFCVSLVSGGISAFGPIVLQDFGLDPFQTIQYNMIPGAIGIFANIIAAYFAMRFRVKGPVVLAILVFPVAAAAALYAIPRGPGSRNSLLAVYFILQIFQPLTPIIFSWTFANTAGHTKKTVTTGMLFVGLCVGNMVGPQLYFPSESPVYQSGLIANMVVLCLMFVLVILQILYLVYLNKRNAVRRKAAGKTGPNIDYSLQDSAKWSQMRAAAAQAGEKPEREVVNEHAFEDLTDLKNDDFVYSL